MCEAGHCGEDIPAEDGHRGWQETVAGRIGCSLLFCPSALQTTTKSAVEGLVSRSIAQQTKARLYQEQRNMHLLIRSSKGSAALFQRCPSSVQVFCPLPSHSSLQQPPACTPSFIPSVSTFALTLVLPLDSHSSCFSFHSWNSCPIYKPSSGDLRRVFTPFVQNFVSHSLFSRTKNLFILSLVTKQNLGALHPHVQSWLC